MSEELKKVLKEKVYDIMNESDDLSKIESKIMNFFKQGRASKVTKEKPFANDPRKIVSIISSRDWGEWEMPEGEDDDDGDYDWEVLTRNSTNKIRKFIAELDKEFRSYKFQYRVEEKNYVEIDIMKK